jgi:hypothetical protein
MGSDKLHANLFLCYMEIHDIFIESYSELTWF